jgi:hypothetical protein
LLNQGDPWAWNAADGSVIDPPIDPLPGTFGNGRYVLRGPSTTWIHQHPKVSQWLMKYRLSSVVNWMEQQQHRRYLYDKVVDRVVGRMGDHAWLLAEDEDHLGFSVESWGYIAHYPLPPRANWLWLMAWAIGPPVGVVLLRMGWRGYRSRFHLTANTDAVPLATAS